MAARRAIAALLLLAAGLGATASRQLLQSCADEKTSTSNAKTKAFLAANYGERAVAKYADTCAAPANKNCQARPEGCSLWVLGQTHCTGDQAAFAKKHGFVYSGSSKKGPGQHVIGIPCAPVRGVEDVPADKNGAVAATRAMWPQMWADMTSGSIRADGSGYPAATGALVINTPSNREYHQLHIHAGVRTPQFDKCVARMSYKSNEKWQLMDCDGLQEGGDTSAKKVDAQLLYKTVKSLGDVWGAYTQGLKQGGLAVGGTDTSKYHVGMLVTSPTPKLRNGQWFVVLYAPPSLKAPKLGRGSFLVGV